MGIAIYQENAVVTQSHGQIVVMLYEGAIKFLKQAAAAMEKGDHQSKVAALHKAMDIINELNINLDMEKGGAIATMAAFPSKSRLFILGKRASMML